jgi:hypothetical protein
MTYVLCLDNEGYELSLTVRKVYKTLTDNAAEKQGFVRIIDDTDEDYVFPLENFVPITVPLRGRSAFGSQTAQQ